MQADLAASQLRMFLCSCFRLDRHSNRRPATARLIAVVLVFTSTSLSSSGYCESPLPAFQKIFHLVGVPGLKRDARVDLTPDSDGLLFSTSKVQYRVPYPRIRQVLVLPSDRRYEGRTYAAALATYGVGSLLILKKHHVDTIVVDYVNDRGGKMGIVVQMETSQGVHFSDLLKTRGVSVLAPEDIPESPAKESNQ